MLLASQVLAPVTDLTPETKSVPEILILFLQSLVPVFIFLQREDDL